MADVFLSYARDDLAAVRPLVAMLEEQGWSVFWDREIKPGQAWTDRIESELDASKAAVVVWTKASTQSDWVKAEANAARERSILVPVRLDGSPIPLPFGMIQTADLSATVSQDMRNEAIEQLLEAVGGLVQRPPVKRSPAASPAVSVPVSTWWEFDWNHVFLNLNGRMGRKEFWLALLVLLPVVYVLQIAGEAIHGASSPAADLESKLRVVFFVYVLTLYPMLALVVKRLHDIGWSGAWATPIMILHFLKASAAPSLQSNQPDMVTAAAILIAVGWIPWILVGLARSTKAPNRYGPPAPAR